MTFSPDGKLLATGDEFGTIRLMDVATSKRVAALKGHGASLMRSCSTATGDGCTRRVGTD